MASLSNNKYRLNSEFGNLAIQGDKHFAWNFPRKFIYFSVAEKCIESPKKTITRELISLIIYIRKTKIFNFFNRVVI